MKLFILLQREHIEESKVFVHSFGGNWGLIGQIRGSVSHLFNGSKSNLPRRLTW